MGEQTEISAWVDRLYEESDKKAFEIMHRIAALAVENTVEVLTK